MWHRRRGQVTSAGGGQGDNSASAAGAVYVFTRSGSTWTQQAYLKASNADPGDLFGVAVAISGDTVIVGADGEASLAGAGEADNSGGSVGAAYVFTRSGTTWSQQAFLKASNADSGDNFGFSVAISGDTGVVGAIYESSSAGGGESDNSASLAGAAYVFTRAGSTWSQQAFLKGSNAQGGDEFGYSVAISGDRLIVGAIHEDSDGTSESDNSAGDSGAAYVFSRAGSAWTQDAYLKASTVATGDFFGIEVALDGDTAAVGIRHHSTSAGAASIFLRVGSSWTETAFTQASNSGTGDQFGDGVAITGQWVMVTAPYEDSDPAVGGTDDSKSAAGACYGLR